MPQYVERPMRSRLLLATCLVACTSRPPATPRPAIASPGAPAAPADPQATVAPASPAPPTPAMWIRFMAQSTYFCVRLPDGQLRSTAYGVGGSTYSLQQGIEIGHGERDALCTNYGITVLGARGQLGTTSPYHSNYNYYTPELVEPRARSLGRIGVSRCYVDDAGAIDCVNTNGTASDDLAAMLNKVGPVHHMLPAAQCAVYRDGQVQCASENGPHVLYPMFTDAVDAAIVSAGWSRFIGCALLRSGKVACRGSNALVLRTFADRETTGPVEIPGLDRIDEITFGGNTACARRGGQVYCWGEAAAMQAGGPAFDASKPMPKCVVDDAKTKAAQDAFDAAQKECQDPKRPRGRDDPLCRSMWQAQRPGPVFKESATPCDPYAGKANSRWVAPKRVPDIDDALAIATNGRLTCALRPANVMTCWGAEIREPKSITFPPRTIAAEVPSTSSTVATRRGLSVELSHANVLVTSASGVLTQHTLATSTLSAGTQLDRAVLDVLLLYDCKLATGGTITCGAPRDFPTSPTAVRLVGIMGTICTIEPDGLLRCGNKKSREYGSTRAGAALAAVGPIVDASGIYARYADGSVRAYRARHAEAPGVFTLWSRVKAHALGADGQSACAVLTTGDVECAPYMSDVVRILGVSRATTVATSSSHACATTEDGRVWCWEHATKKPSVVKGVTDAIAVGVGTSAQGMQQACAVTKQGELACWGGGSSSVRLAPTTIN